MGGRGGGGRGVKDKIGGKRVSRGFLSYCVLNPPRVPFFTALLLFLFFTHFWTFFFIIFFSLGFFVFLFHTIF